MLDLSHGLREPIKDLLQQGQTAPFVVFCNKLGFYQDGEYESEYGHITVYTSLFHQPLEDITVMSLATWEAIQKEQAE